MEDLIRDLEKEGKTKGEIALVILNSDDMELDEVFWVSTVERDANFNEEKCPYLDEPITKREILLSKLIGQPYPTYFLEGIIDFRRDCYRNEISTPKESRADYAIFYEARISERKNKGQNLATDKTGRIQFGYNKSGEKMDGYIEITESELLKAGLDPEKIGWEPYQRITLRDISEAGVKKKINLLEIGGVKKLFDKIKAMGRGE